MAERRPPWVSDEHFQSMLHMFRDYEAGHRQALSQVHDLLRAADLTSPASVLLAVATIANLTQQSRAQPYEDFDVPNVVSNIVFNVASSGPTASESPDELSSNSEGILVIDIPEGEEESEHSYYSGSDTLNYIPDNISDDSE